jgi:uncharacterized protein YgbK (DUF1537 family)
MITVLADDITGAAEIAGICLRFGLSVAFDFDSQIAQVPVKDVWIIVSDTRSLPEKEACDIVKQTVNLLKEKGVKRIYKKIDSALRGHILPETAILLNILPYRQALILPANPEMGRIVRNGLYYINDSPLNETSFADDPDFPAKSAKVGEVLKNSQPEKFLIPDCIHPEDFEPFAQSLQAETLPVGGSAFFEAYLQVYFPSAKQQKKELPLLKKPMGKQGLMICGSTHETSKQFIRETQAFDIVEIPQNQVEQLMNPAFFSKWIRNTIDIFARNNRLLITLEDNGKYTASTEKVKKLLATITRQIGEDYPVEELFIEGGATAYACLQACGIHSLIPIEEYARGVVRMKIPGKRKRFITIKPGSYPWPDKLFQV